MKRTTKFRLVLCWTRLATSGGMTFVSSERERERRGGGDCFISLMREAFNIRVLRGSRDGDREQAIEGRISTLALDVECMWLTGNRGDKRERRSGQNNISRRSCRKWYVSLAKLTIRCSILHYLLTCTHGLVHYHTIGRACDAGIPHSRDRLWRWLAQPGHSFGKGLVNDGSVNLHLIV